MNPYRQFADLLFTCVDATKDEVVELVLSRFNRSTPSDVEQALLAGAKQAKVFENGVPKTYRRGDALPPRDGSSRYFTKEVPLDFSLAYINHAERNTTKLRRMIFWEPRIHPRKTVFMGLFRDGLSHSVWSLSRHSPNTWINIRIYDDADYPGCFLDLYADNRRVLRRIMACKDEEGWDFGLEGPIQPFENPAYYSRRLKKDRLTRPVITEYMEKLGFSIAHDGFWETEKPAHFLWQERQPPQARTNSTDA